MALKPLIAGMSQSGAALDGGASIVTPLEGHANSSGSDTTGDGSAGNPYATAQKLYNVGGFSTWRLGVGAFTLTVTNDWTAPAIFGAGQLVTSLTITARGTDGTAPGGNATNGFDLTITGDRSLRYVLDCSGRAGATGATGATDESGETGGNGGNGSSPGLLTLGGIFASLITANAGAGGTGGTGGTGTVYFGGEGGTGGNGGAMKQHLLRFCRVTSMTANDGVAGPGGQGGYGFSTGGIPANPGNIGNAGTQIEINVQEFSALDNLICPFAPVISASTLGGTFTA